MQAFAEFVPWIAFGLVYWLGGGLYPATGTLMVAMALLLLFDWITSRKVPRMHLVLALLVWVFGTATLVLHDVRFLQWKASVFYWIAGIVFAASAFIGKQTLLERLLASGLPEGLTVPRSSWRNSSVLLGLFYIVLGAVNIWIALNRSEADWVRFKVVIAPIVAIVVTIAIVLWVMRGAFSKESTS
jgi:intracellular septation protein